MARQLNKKIIYIIEAERTSLIRDLLKMLCDGNMRNQERLNKHYRVNIKWSYIVYAETEHVIRGLLMALCQDDKQNQDKVLLYYPKL